MFTWVSKNPFCESQVHMLKAHKHLLLPNCGDIRVVRKKKIINFCVFILKLVYVLANHTKHTLQDRGYVDARQTHSVHRCSIRARWAHNIHACQKYERSLNARQTYRQIYSYVAILVTCARCACFRLCVPTNHEY